MMIKIDMESQEFKDEMEKTKKFTDKVCENFGFVYHPNAEVNEGVSMGLARNKIIYNKRFCPCFMVIGETKEERKAADNRVCPCPPALEKEIPEDGKCHCGIFCTPEYAKENAIVQEKKEETKPHSKGLENQECETILANAQLNGEQIESLLEARQLGMIDFNLVDVREWMEWNQQRIVGTDYLIPTTSFYETLKQIEDQKDKTVIVYCLTGSRSAYCQNVMKDIGFKHVANYQQGIIAYSGDCTSGEES